MDNRVQHIIYKVEQDEQFDPVGIILSIIIGTALLLAWIGGM